MRIAGYQPLSLIDYPGVICSIVFTQGCPFRCPYCHNPELIPHTKETGHSVEEILEKIDKDAKMLEGVCVTGGQPCIHPDLGDLLRAIKKRRLLVKLDTNGVNPAMVKKFLDERLIDYAAMDLKHVWARYDEVARTGSAAAIEHCKKTFDLLQASGIPHEFRTTVSPSLHSEDELVAMARQLAPGSNYALQALRYGKMLDPKHPRGTMDLVAVADRIRQERPDLRLEVRS